MFSFWPFKDREHLQQLDEEVGALSEDLTKVEGDIAGLQADVLTLTHDLITAHVDLTSATERLAKLTDELVLTNATLNKLIAAGLSNNLAARVAKLEKSAPVSIPTGGK